MIIKRMFKFTLPALLLAASVSAYADGPVTLKDGKTKMSWADFAKAINNPSSIVSDVDSTALKNARIAYKDALDIAKGKATAVTEAQTAYDNAVHNQNQWAAQISSLQADRSTKQEDRDSKKEDLSQVNDQLKSAQTNLVAKLNALKSPFQTQLAAKQAEIADKQEEIEQLKEGEKKTAPWLTDIKEDCAIFNNAFKKMPAADAPDIEVYYSFTEDPAEETTTLTLSFKYLSGLKEASAKSLYQTLIADIGGVSVFIDIVKLYVNEAYGEPDSDGYENFVNVPLKNVGAICNTTISKIPSTDYQEVYVDDAAVTKAEDELKTLENDEAAIISKISIIDKHINNINDIKSESDIDDVKEIVGIDTTVLSQAIAIIKEIYTYNDNITTLDTDISKLNGEIQNLATQINNIQTELKKLTTVGEDGKTGLDRLKDAIATAQSELDDANDEVDAKRSALLTAQSAYDKAVAEAQEGVLDNYEEITLTEDIIANEVISNYDGIINGGGHVITLASPATSVFNRFSGTLIFAAVNGKFSTANNNAVFNSVANWNGANTGVYYDANGKRTGSIATLGQLGYLAREDFGVDSNFESLVGLTAETKVYSITVYDPNNSVPNYVHVIDNKFMGKGDVEVSVPTNMFAKSESSDVKDLDFVNVFYFDGVKNVCENVNIVDQVDFYCPVDLTAAKVSYSRSFNSGMYAVCVPFEVTHAMVSENSSLCTYDRETLDKFWFTKVGGSIAPNTPFLLMSTGSIKWDNLTDVAIKKTETQVVKFQDTVEGAGQSFGTFKKVTSDEFAGAFNAGKIYGLRNGKFQLAGDGSYFPAFLMALSSSMTTQEASQLPERYIGIHDEFGNVIVDKYDDDYLDEIISGVKNVKSDASSISVAAGQGEIIITSEADYGDVAIYSIDGKMVAKVNVVAGTNNVNVQKGIYIVMGKKVMVK